MAVLTLFSLVALVSGLGILAHLSYFINGEHQTEGRAILLMSLGSPLVLGVALHQFVGLSLYQAVRLTSVTWWSFFLSLWSSMLIYRAFFHRLGGFSGPFGAKLSKFWHVSQVLNLDNYKQMDKLHRQYGEYVRIGPAELSVTDPNAIEIVHGPRSRCTKAPWYDLGDKNPTVHMCRDKLAHEKRRRTAWDRAFSAKALRSYQNRVSGYADALVIQVATFSGQPLNMSRWFNYFACDVMGDLAFGKSFDMIKTAKAHWVIQIILETSAILGVLGPVSWMILILLGIPGLAEGPKRCMAWTIEQVEQRRKMKLDEPDIMSWLLEPTEEISGDPKVNEAWLYGDARLIVIAGTDTTTATLTYAFYHLAENESHVAKIREEIADTEMDELSGCHHLNAVINETLRLHPPVPSGVFRMTPPEGVKIGDRYIPGETNITMPTWSIQRSPFSFADPNSFIPERWSTKPDLILNKKAFMPFGVGPYACIGKQLALMEVRTVIAKLIMRFDVALAPDEDGIDLLEKTKDYFVLGLGKLNLCFTERKAVRRQASRVV